MYLLISDAVYMSQGVVLTLRMIYFEHDFLLQGLKTPQQLVNKLQQACQFNQA